MSDNEVTPESKPRRRAAGRPAGPPVDAPADKADKAPDLRSQGYEIFDLSASRSSCLQVRVFVMNPKK
mgnify:CR=1 FL=1